MNAIDQERIRRLRPIKNRHGAWTFGAPDTELSPDNLRFLAHYVRHLEGRQVWSVREVPDGGAWLRTSYDRDSPRGRLFFGYQLSHEMAPQLQQILESREDGME